MTFRLYNTPNFTRKQAKTNDKSMCNDRGVCARLEKPPAFSRDTADDTSGPDFKRSKSTFLHHLYQYLYSDTFKTLK